MRSFVSILALVAIAVFTAACLSSCASKTVDSRAALAQSDYVPSVRSAMDSAPGGVGPVEIVSFAIPPDAPLMLKGGLIWDGTTFALPSPAAQAAPYAAPQCGEVYTAPYASPCNPQPQAAPTGRWVWVNE